MKTLHRFGFGLLACFLAIAAALVWGAASHGQALVPPTGPLLNAPPHLPELLLGGLIINQANLADLFTAFRAQFKQGFEAFQKQSMWGRIATRVPSSTRDNHYAWLGQWPQLRKWIGDRQLKGLAAHDYRIVNEKFESTIEVPRDDIEDDQFGIYSTQANGMGLAAAQHPDELIFALLLGAFAELGYDGKPYFATDHPVGEGVASNNGGGGGTPWFLFDTMKPLKPLIFQVRREYEFKMMTKPDDEAVFMRDAYRYGVDARVNVGFGFWQLGYGSKQTLDKNAYAAAGEAMMSLKSDEGRPLGVVPNLLVVPPTLRGEALEILNAERDAAGATNVYKGTAELLVVPWLA